MATYAYDAYRITFTPRDDGTYEVVAVDPAGVTRHGEFRVPSSAGELVGAVGGALTAARGATRDVGGAVTTPTADIEDVGAALADALVVGPVGDGYEAAIVEAARTGRGVRLTLSLASAPALLSVPWEFLFRRPRFLASQRKSPVVRLLETGAEPSAARIDSTVRILGVGARPTDLARLDVDKERAGVEAAVARVRELGRVELDWLEPATTKRLRETLRDGTYHVLHFAGHSAFTDSGDGILYLENEDGGFVAVDETLFANLLGDQDQLRLVVLNSCEGARTTLSDPYAGVATTLVELGVPAVVAMQFEISDEAAIVFASELYLNLIGRQAPIDAAVAEARKAVYCDVDPVEWATPVLFVRDPDVELFNFEVEPAEQSQPPPADPAVPARYVDTRPHSGFGALQVARPDGDIHLLTVDTDCGADGVATDLVGARDTEPDWHRLTNWLAFHREATAGTLQGICYVVPDDVDDGVPGHPAAQLVPQRAGTHVHAPAWGRGNHLFYAMTAGCGPGPTCQEEIRMVAFDVGQDGTGDQDALTARRDIAILTGVRDLRDLAGDPHDDEQVAFADGDGVALATGGMPLRLDTSIDDVRALAYTRAGHHLAALGTLEGRSVLELWDRDGTPRHIVDVASAARTYADDGGQLHGLDLATIRAVSVTPGFAGDTLIVTLNDDDPVTNPIPALIGIDDVGAAITDSDAFLVTALAAGTVQAIAF